MTTDDNDPLLTEIERVFRECETSLLQAILMIEMAAVSNDTSLYIDGCSSAAATLHELLTNLIGGDIAIALTLQMAAMGADYYVRSSDDAERVKAYEDALGAIREAGARASEIMMTHAQATRGGGMPSGGGQC